MWTTTKGVLIFEGDASFVRNLVETDDSVEQGRGGAVSNTGSGSIMFKSKLTVTENDADVSLEDVRKSLLCCLQSTQLSLDSSQEKTPTLRPHLVATRGLFFDVGRYHEKSKPYTQTS